MLNEPLSPVPATKSCELNWESFFATGRRTTGTLEPSKIYTLSLTAVQTRPSPNRQEDVMKNVGPKQAAWVVSINRNDLYRRDTHQDRALL